MCGLWVLGCVDFDCYLIVMVGSLFLVFRFGGLCLVWLVWWVGLFVVGCCFVGWWCVCWFDVCLRGFLLLLVVVWAW